MNILETERLTRCFGELKAVDGLTVAVEAGEVFGLLGPNGAGKTTVIKMLCTLLPPTSGMARVAGFDIVQQATDVRRMIGYVPQMLSADGSLTGYENILVFAKLYDIPRAEREARIREALAYMWLSEAADKLVREYSGGMIRRLEIAQSMMHEPRLLFLDEPTLGLEVHVELNTRSKMFCGCPTRFGANPNTQVCPVCLGLPGSLPVVNSAAVDAAISMGLALNCTIPEKSHFDRKNYYYPDSPKNYQITQFSSPIAENGFFDVHVPVHNFELVICPDPRPPNPGARFPPTPA